MEAMGKCTSATVSLTMKRYVLEVRKATDVYEEAFGR
jgi:hypothetical protein